MCVVSSLSRKSLWALVWILSQVSSEHAWVQQLALRHLNIIFILKYSFSLLVSSFVKHCQSLNGHPMLQIGAHSQHSYWVICVNNILRNGKSITLAYASAAHFTDFPVVFICNAMPSHYVISLSHRTLSEQSCGASVVYLLEGFSGSQFSRESFSKGLAGKVPSALLKQLVYLYLANTVNFITTQAVLPLLTDHKLVTDLSSVLCALDFTA